MDKKNAILWIYDSSSKKIDPCFFKAMSNLILVYKDELIKICDSKKKEKLLDFWKIEYKSTLMYDKNNQFFEKIYFKNELDKSLFLMKFS
jgi:hypothetical protein